METTRGLIRGNIIKISIQRLLTINRKVITRYFVDQQLLNMLQYAKVLLFCENTIKKKALSTLLIEVRMNCTKVMWYNLQYNSKFMSPMEWVVMSNYALS